LLNKQYTKHKSVQYCSMTVRIYSKIISVDGNIFKCMIGAQIQSYSTEHMSDDFLLKKKLFLFIIKNVKQN
jgi:hypothetical protein